MHLGLCSVIIVQWISKSLQRW